MADFIARIRAELDTSQAQAQLRQLTSAQHVIPVRIELDASSINNLLRNLGSGSSGGLIQNFGNLGKQAGNAFVDNYFREQRQLARRAKQLQDQFPTSKVQSRADSFYLKAARAEAQEATKIEKEKLAEQDKIRKVFEQQQVQERRKQAKEIQREQTAHQKEEEKLQKLFEQQQVQTRRKQYQEQQALERQEARRVESERLKTQRVFEQQQVAQRQQASQYSQSFNNGKYTADQTVMGENLKAYDGQNTEALGRARAALEEYKGIMAELQQHYDPSQTLSFNDGELVNKFNNLENAAEKYKNAMREVGAESSKSLKPFEAQTESNKIIKYFNDNSKAAKKYGDRLKELADRMSKATTVGEKQNILTEFNNVKSAISAEGLTGRTIFDEISRGFSKVGQFIGTYRIIMEAVKTLKKMVSEVTAVDSALIELRKVSDASDVEIQQSFDAATASAKKYGTAISDVINSQADWARLGYGVKEAQQLADVTTLFQTVGDNMTQETASQGLISILKGYQMDVSQAESIIDKLNEVANTSPIDTAGLTEALERSVSSMAAAGNTLDESIGLITAANAVVQDPATVGTAFKTLTMRIRGAKTE